MAVKAAIKAVIMKSYRRSRQSVLRLHSLFCVQGTLEISKSYVQRVRSIYLQIKIDFAYWIYFP